VSSATLAARRLPQAEGAAWIAVAAGGAVWIGCLALDAAEAWAGLLVASLFGLALALGAMLFVAIHVATGARWWWPLTPVLRPMLRALAAPAAMLGVCLVGGLGTLYAWARPGAVEASPLLAAKSVWLSPPLFLARAGLILAVWLGFASALDRRVEAVLESGAVARWRGLVRVAIGFLPAFAFTCSVGAWDWTMSLEPEWYSTMRGVYVFAGTFLAGIAAVTAGAVYLDGRGRLGRALPAAVRHDLGKMLFAFATFWGYIWFCEFLLIWYANLPEETSHYLVRLSGGWSTLFWLSPVLSFGVPFVLLMSAASKRQPPLLFQVSLVVLVGRWLDGFLMVQPSLSGTPPLPVAAAAATAALLGAMWLLTRLGGRSATPG